MKNSLIKISITVGLTVSSQAASIAVGDQVGLDFGPTTTNNWNNITSNNAGIPAGEVINLGGVVMDGMSIITSNSQFANNDGTNNWSGLSTEGGAAPAEFVDSVTTDITGNFNLGDGSPYTVILSGLSIGLRYDVTAVTTASFTRIDTVSINGGTPSSISRPDSVAGAFHSFSGVSANGSGELVITVVDTAATENPVINGLLVTAVPESSSLALLSFASLAFLVRRR